MWKPMKSLNTSCKSFARNVSCVTANWLTVRTKMRSTHVACSSVRWYRSASLRRTPPLIFPWPDREWTNWKTAWNSGVREVLFWQRQINLENAFRSLSSGNLNTGLTYSNFEHRRTVMVIAMTTSPEQFQNSWDHEKGHLCRHISRTFGIDPYGEEEQYLRGYIGQKMFPVAKKFLCECCRNKLIREIHGDS